MVRIWIVNLTDPTADCICPELIKIVGLVMQELQTYTDAVESELQMVRRVSY